MPFNVQLNYKIYNKMQFFWFFYTNTTGTSFGRTKGLPTVAKEVGCYPTGTLRKGQSPANNYIFFIIFLFNFFPPQKVAKSAIIKTLYRKNIYQM